MLEIFLGVILPLLLFAYAIRNEKVGIIRFSAFLTVFGVVLNRVNTAMITFNWKLAEREIPHWREALISVTIFAIYITVYRFILYRLPILYQWKTADETVEEMATAREGAQYSVAEGSAPMGTYRSKIESPLSSNTFSTMDKGD
jgi:Ni/Fe-hydrogenase subunit HybB-like protein